MSDYEYDSSYIESSDDDDCGGGVSNEPVLTIEEWHDWYSEDLLNLWMSVVQYHDEWYLPLRRTFNEFCDFIFHGDSFDPNMNMCDAPPEIQAIKDHPFIKGLDWNYFFSLGTK